MVISQSCQTKKINLHLVQIKWLFDNGFTKRPTVASTVKYHWTNNLNEMEYKLKLQVEGICIAVENQHLFPALIMNRNEWDCGWHDDVCSLTSISWCKTERCNNIKRAADYRTEGFSLSSSSERLSSWLLTENASLLMGARLKIWSPNVPEIHRIRFGATREGFIKKALWMNLNEGIAWRKMKVIV